MRAYLLLRILLQNKDVITQFQAFLTYFWIDLTYFFDNPVDGIEAVVAVLVFVAATPVAITVAFVAVMDNSLSDGWIQVLQKNNFACLHMEFRLLLCPAFDGSWSSRLHFLLCAAA